MHILAMNVFPIKPRQARGGVVGVSTITSMRDQIPYHRKKVQGARYIPMCHWLPSRPGTRHRLGSIYSIASVQEMGKVEEKLFIS
jgi:hypothetical protein